ncbi:MAG: ATP synthase subunit I [Cyclobacterium sp.]|uniref:ATP synthase subunit I n=1 Tax=unclassified Cyclobacterium TaxID=2615055 RepID=UPI0013D11D9E|nr:ATP synthase subunit I [Cyclobacterium sp. SYSU L10401]
MNETLFMIIALLTGVAMGILFFGGLWITVKKAVSSKTPALWFLGSFILRMGIAIGGFYLILKGGNWLSGLICLAGFIVTRYIVIRHTRAYDEKVKFVTKDENETVHEA